MSGDIRRHGVDLLACARKSKAVQGGVARHRQIIRDRGHDGHGDDVDISAALILLHFGGVGRIDSDIAPNGRHQLRRRQLRPHGRRVGPGAHLVDQGLRHREGVGIGDASGGVLQAGDRV